jgi:nitrogen PTS system EIIA component
VRDLTSFGLGRGLAIPHASVTGLPKALGAFAQLETPVDFGAADGQPADLVLLILAPEGKDSMLLRALSCVARRLRDREVAAKLRSADTAEAVHMILTTDSWHGRELVENSQPGAESPRNVAFDFRGLVSNC